MGFCHFPLTLTTGPERASDAWKDRLYSRHTLCHLHCAAAIWFPLGNQGQSPPHQYITPFLRLLILRDKLPRVANGSHNFQSNGVVVFLGGSVTSFGGKISRPAEPRMTGWEASIFQQLMRAVVSGSASSGYGGIRSHAAGKFSAYSSSQSTLLGTARSFHLDSGALCKRPSHHLLRPVVSGWKGKWQH